MGSVRSAVIVVRRTQRTSSPAGRGGAGGNYYYTRLSYLDRNYTQLAFSRYYQNLIDDVQLADYLDVAPRNISTFEGYFLRGSE